MANVYSPDSAGGDQPVYQGGAFTDIHALGTALGGNVNRNIQTGDHTINGQSVPWVTAVGGQYRGSVHDIAQAAGGRVERGTDGSYQVFAPKAAPTPTGGGVSVTGNPQPAPPTQPATPTQPAAPLEHMPTVQGPGNPLQRLASLRAAIPSVPGSHLAGYYPPPGPDERFPALPPPGLRPAPQVPPPPVPGGHLQPPYLPPRDAMPPTYPQGPGGQPFPNPGDAGRPPQPYPGDWHQMPPPQPTPFPTPGAVPWKGPGDGTLQPIPGVPFRPFPQPPGVPDPTDRQLYPSDPGIHILPFPNPGNPLRRLLPGNGAQLPPSAYMPGRPPVIPQPPGVPVMAAQSGGMPATGAQQPTASPQPTPADALRRLAPGGPSPVPGMVGRPPITSPVQPPPMSAMGSAGPGPLPGDPLRNAAPGAVGPTAPQPAMGIPGRSPNTVNAPSPGGMSTMNTDAQTAAANTTPPGFSYQPQQTPAAQALGQRVMAQPAEAQTQSVQAQSAAQYTLQQLLDFGLTFAQAQEYLNDPKNATNAANPNNVPEGFQYTPGPPTPAAVDLGEKTMGKDNQVTDPGAPADTGQQGAPPAVDPASYGPQQFQMPAFNYQDSPIDYAALQQRAQMEAQMWADPALQQLKNAALAAQQQYGNQTGYVNRDLAASIGDLRGGEAAREQRISEDMNRRGDAIYNSGIRYAGLAQQQAATVAQESKLTTTARNALTKLSDSLGLTLQDITSKKQQLAGQQGEKAYLTLQQLADKATTQQFENRKLAWQMWQQGASLTLQQQQMANQLWSDNQRLKSEDARADADRALKLAIANGQLEQKWAAFYGKDAQGNPSFEAQKWAQTQADDAVKAAGYARMPDGSLVRSLDGRKFDLASADSMSQQLGYVIGVDGKPLLDGQGQPVRTLEGAKFDWTKQQFIISEGDKVAYQNELISLRQQGLITQQQHNSAMEEIGRGHVSIQNAQLIESNRHNTALETNTANQQTETNRHNTAMENKPPGGNPNSAANSAWKGVTGELGALTDPLKAANMNQAQRQAAAQAIVGRWMPQLGAQEQQALKQWLKANGLM